MTLDTLLASVIGLYMMLLFALLFAPTRSRRMRLTRTLIRGVSHVLAFVLIVFLAAYLGHLLWSATMTGPRG